MSLINLLGVPDNDPTPNLALIENRYAQGASVSSGSADEIVLLGNKLASGSALDGYLYSPTSMTPVRTSDDCAAMFGRGSELHRMYLAVRKVNKNVGIHCAPFAESAGAKATLAIKVTGTATASAAFRVWIGIEFVDVSIVLGDTPTDMAQSIADAINSKPDWAVTATAATDTCTVSAKQKGPRGNQLVGCAQVQGTGSGVSVTPNMDVNFTGGTTADDVASALLALGSNHLYYIVSAANDATNANKVLAHVNSQAEPSQGNRQRCVFGSTDSVGTVVALSTALNGPLAELQHLHLSEMTAGELAAHSAGVFQLVEASFNASSLNLSNYGLSPTTQPTWAVPAPRRNAKLTANEVKTLLNSGVTPIQPTAGGRTMLVKRITTYFLNGPVADYRCRDAHKVTVTHKFSERLATKFVAQLSNKTIVRDALPGERILQGTVSRVQVQSLIFSVIDEFDALGVLTNVADIKAGTLVVFEPGNPNRISDYIPLQSAPILDQLATVVAESSAG